MKYYGSILRAILVLALITVILYCLTTALVSVYASCTTAINSVEEITTTTDELLKEVIRSAKDYSVDLKGFYH